MSASKYIVVQESGTGNLSILIFSNLLIHREVARGFKVLSAGFVSFYPDEGPAGEFHCYGRSESLDIDSNPERDNKLANKLLYL